MSLKWLKRAKKNQIRATKSQKKPIMSDMSQNEPKYAKMSQNESEMSPEELNWGQKTVKKRSKKYLRMPLSCINGIFLGL